MVDALEGTPPDTHWDLLAVEEAHDGRQEEVHVVVESAAKLLQRRQELASHLAISAGGKKNNLMCLRGFLPSMICLNYRRSND